MGTYIFKVLESRETQKTRSKGKVEIVEFCTQRSIVASQGLPTQDVPFTIKSHLCGDGIGV